MFPSPMGIISVSMSCELCNLLANGVSVPYGDHICLNTSKNFGVNVFTEAFPSPMGIISVSMETQ